MLYSINEYKLNIQITILFDVIKVVFFLNIYYEFWTDISLPFGISLILPIHT